MLREALKRIPGARHIIHQMRRLQGRIMPHELTFAQVARHNEWSDPTSVSGTGSNLEATRAIREALPVLWRRYRINYLLDIPCGDFEWMRTAVNDLERYLGMDVVRSIVSRNKRLYGGARVQFRVGNLLSTALPTTDCILCRDCLVHFSYRDIQRALRNIMRTESTYLIATTFPDHANRDSITGAYWRPINLETPPFSFPAPLELINEACTELNGECADKSLGLWKLSDLRRQLAS